MATFAMICDNSVIEVLYDQEVTPTWPPDPSGNPVTAVVCTDDATRDWKYNPETEEVYEPVYTEPEEPEETEKEPSQLDRIEEKLDMLADGAVGQEYLDYYTAVNAALTGGV